MEQTDHLTEPELSIDREVAVQLAETAKWTRFIGITFFVCCGLMLLMVAFGSQYFSQVFERFSLPMGSEGFMVMAIVMVIVTAVLAVVAWCMLNFGNKVKAGIQTENTELFNRGLNSMKLYFIIAGAFGILSLLGTAKELLEYF